ncbi:Arm DNA-binding domain-containing protein [Desulfonatronovibrio magnus]|uniref:Arm DNA-binding domain-containing protein n=1 Tax=Desulfonatronovibrio magnus TaxID=698827 RepID=UPI0005EBB11B|nr:Arm DNA-binding domain-containing protein [Desulfonatronovibrio magnus]
MPKVFLKQSFVDNPPIPADEPKVQYFDAKVAGFILEVSKTGRATYYLRYRDKSSRIRQFRIGPADSMTVEQARERAKGMKKESGDIMLPV